MMADGDHNAQDGKRQRGGRNARREARSHGDAGSKRPYIVRGIPTYDILSEESLIRIEATADRILAETGIEFRDDPEALTLWRAAGADVQGTLVKFPPGLLRELVSTAPREFTQHARNPANNVQIGGKNVVFAPAYGSPFVMDLDKGRRFGTLEDFQNFIKLAQGSPWFHHSGGTICEPTDIAVNKRHLDMVMAHLTLSDRPFMGSVTAEERAATMYWANRLSPLKCGRRSPFSLKSRRGSVSNENWRASSNEATLNHGRCRFTTRPQKLSSPRA